MTVTLTHPGEGDHAEVKVWPPKDTWNGRLQTVGGSAFAAGDYGTALAGAVKNGYAAATTDAGVKTYLDTSWALDTEGRVDTPLLKNEAAAGDPDVKALVYVAAFLPAPGETALELTNKYPGSTLPGTLDPVAVTNPDGTKGADLYIQQDKFRHQFAADVPRNEAAAARALPWT
ncbi:hypothetical protein [Streptomyces sp. NPDC003863]